MVFAAIGTAAVVSVATAVYMSWGARARFKIDMEMYTADLMKLMAEVKDAGKGMEGTVSKEIAKGLFGEGRVGFFRGLLAVVTLGKAKW